MHTIRLNDAERAAVIEALYEYRFETESYIRSTDPATAGGHDDCCSMARQRDALMRERHEALKRRLRDIDGALLEIDPQP